MNIKLETAAGVSTVIWNVIVDDGLPSDVSSQCLFTFCKAAQFAPFVELPYSIEGVFWVKHETTVVALNAKS